MSDTPPSDLSALLRLMEADWSNAASYIAAHPKKELLPRFTAQSADGVISVFATPWSGEEDKRMMLILLKAHFQAMNIKRYTAASEVWMAAYEGKADESDPNFKMPSERSDRKEMLWVIGVDAEAGVILQYHAEIVRRNGRRKLKERQSVPHTCGLSGRMFDLLGPIKTRTVN